LDEQSPEPTPVTDYFPALADEVAGFPPLDWWLNPRTGELVGKPAGDPDTAIAAFAQWCVEREGGQYERVTTAGYFTSFICRTMLADRPASVRMIVPLTDAMDGDVLARRVAAAIDKRLALG